MVKQAINSYIEFIKRSFWQITPALLILGCLLLTFVDGRLGVWGGGLLIAAAGLEAAIYICTLKRGDHGS